MYRRPLVRGPLQLAPFLRLFSSSPQTPPQTPSPTAAAGRLTFEVGVAFAGKTRRRGEQVPRGMSAFTDKEKVQWRDAMLNEWGPKTTTAGSAGVKKADAGEDFFFVREEREMTTLGVADGVGGWAESGVDPSVFSQALMYFGWQASAMPQLGPGGILQKAYDDTLAEKEVKAGSATACILQLNSESGICNSANLGDSGYSVIRNGNQFLEIPGAQQHYFNCPRQLAKVPHRRGYSSNISDQPKDADLFSVQLKEGDVLVLFTDGLSDNIHPQELILLLAQASQLTPPPSPASSTDSLSAPPPTPRGEGLAQKYADACLRYGQICMTAHDKVSPFQQAAAQEGYDFRGGKMDDFTVITVVVQRAD